MKENISFFIQKVRPLIFWIFILGVLLLFISKSFDFKDSLRYKYPIEYKIHIINLDSIKATSKSNNYFIKEELTKINNQLEIIRTEIKRVEDINDKRFELLGWGLALLFTVIGTLMVFNFVNSRAAVRDLVYEEISSKSVEITNKFNKIELDINVKQAELDAVISAIQRSASSQIHNHGVQ